MKFLWYEDMKKNLGSVIKDVALFLECHLTNEKVKYVPLQRKRQCFKDSGCYNRW